ncbi:MAG TPA: ATP-dependent DNA helicase, partial [Parasegetibacter sp.]
MSVQQQVLNQKFQETYSQLNEQQKKAVDKIEGPVMVIAGPGTGKTQILSARIAKILMETDARPENILCLTYTDAGVVAMRKRLLSFIGPDAYRVNIHTFHAFCNEIIQENLSLFEKNSLDPISDLERTELLKELIDQFPKNHPLKRYRGDVYFEVSRLQNLFSIMKREGWTPEWINSKIDEYLASLPQRDGFVAKRATGPFKKGDIRTDKIAIEKDKMDKLRAAVNEFERFQQMMRSRNRYDFDDMINWVINAFDENEALLRRYQEQFLYILVDEYQDTSGSQNKLVEQLIRFWDKPNVFVVGDDDQSIYRFQGANIENMLNFADQYKNDLLTVVLTSNYRSIQPILNVSKSLIERNTGRLVNQIEGLSKDLQAGNPKINHLNHLPVIRQYDDQRQEMIDVVMQIESLISRGVKPGRIGVIYRENKYGEELARYFKLKNIPVFSKRNINILHLPLTRQILLLFRYLASEHDIPYSGDAMLFEILHFNWFNIPSIEIAKITAETAERQLSGEKTSLRKLLYDKSNTAPKELFEAGLNEQLKKASAVLETLIADVSNLTLQSLFEKIIRDAGILSHIMQQPDKIEQMQILTALFDFVKEETGRQPLLNVDSLISIIDTMEKENIALSMVQINGNDKGVNLMTAHGSKGLEFEYVFLVGCNSGFWEKKKKPSGRNFTLPDTIFSSATSDQDTHEELRRLFYVAITRAEVHLYISYAKYKNDGKEMEPSLFIAESRAQYPLDIEEISLSPEVISDFSALELTNGSPEIEHLDESFIDKILDKFVMNVTALNTYLKCPLEFYFRTLIRIPSPKNEATEFGSAVHFALERLFKKMLDNNREFPSKESFVEDFEWYMKRHRQSFTREQFARRMEYGQEILPAYYDKYIHTWNKVVVVERSIRNIVYNGVPLKGKLDKLEFDGKLVNVVDYKTGDPTNGKKKCKRPDDKEPLGGDYWRQAVFYKMLIDNYDSRDWKVVSTEFDFIEPDNNKEYQKEKLLITDEDVQ